VNETYADVTEAAENMIQGLFATETPMPAAEIDVRSSLARAVLDAWFVHAKVLVCDETHGAEYDRLGELVRELPLSARVQS
jgi:hypothetical protein